MAYYTLRHFFWFLVFTFSHFYFSKKSGFWILYKMQEHEKSSVVIGKLIISNFRKFTRMRPALKGLVGPNCRTLEKRKCIIKSFCLEVEGPTKIESSGSPTFTRVFSWEHTSASTSKWFHTNINLVLLTNDLKNVYF